MKTASLPESPGISVSNSSRNMAKNKKRGKHLEDCGYWDISGSWSLQLLKMWWLLFNTSRHFSDDHHQMIQMIIRWLSILLHIQIYIKPTNWEIWQKLLGHIAIHGCVLLPSHWWLLEPTNMTAVVTIATKANCLSRCFVSVFSHDSCYLQAKCGWTHGST